jgi:divalent metal cation (Fe/Co/Zn/Cd) transporter
MSRTDWVCLGVVMVGFVLFLYGANFYDGAVGWAGVALFFVGVLTFLVLYIYNELTKKEEAQNP